MRAIVIAVLAACLAALTVTGSATARRLAPSDRKAINATLDTLVNHAVKRKDVGASYDVVTPVLRGGMSREAWSRGAIPVYPYPARGTWFHHWTIRYYNSRSSGSSSCSIRAEAASSGSSCFLPPSPAQISARR